MEGLSKAIMDLRRELDKIGVASGLGGVSIPIKSYVEIARIAEAIGFETGLLQEGPSPISEVWLGGVRFHVPPKPDRDPYGIPLTEAQLAGALRLAKETEAERVQRIKRSIVDLHKRIARGGVRNLGW